VFRIRHAAQLAGINPTLLRAWERRYHLVEPQRTESGYRVYSADDVALLKAAAQLVAGGHTIGEVARLPRSELLASAATAFRAPSDEKSPAPAGAGVVHDETAGTRIDAALDAALDAIARFDRAGFEAALFPVTALVGLPPVPLCERVLLPLLRLIGDRWQRGQLTVAAEHFGSGLCRTKIVQYLEFLARAASGPRVVCACPERELHEGGLLAFAVRAAADRWQVIYLGPNTPLVHVLETATRIDADLVALSMTVPRATEELAEMVARVRAAGRILPTLRVLAGGRQAQLWKADLEAAGIQVAADIATPLPVPPGPSPG
jgi:DNA-binding transcriptional MerR regulator/methylmalonyl-CoA mutase cobalamin-binding subunit